MNTANAGPRRKLGRPRNPILPKGYKRYEMPCGTHVERRTGRGNRGSAMWQELTRQELAFRSHESMQQRA